MRKFFIEVESIDFTSQKSLMPFEEPIATGTMFTLCIKSQVKFNTHIYFDASLQSIFFMTCGMLTTIKQIKV